MKITIFEGTPEEYKSIADTLGKNPSELPEDEKEEVSIKDAYRAMLTRADIPELQKQVYTVLANGELQWTEYIKRMNRSPESIRGIHGTLGRRINGTPEIHQAGLPGNMKAIETWDKVTGLYGLKEEFLEVLKEKGII